MKKGYLIHSEISSIIARMGHKDRLVVADAGLPIPEKIQRIDLAVTAGLPGFLPVITAILTELKVEKVILAQELLQVNPEFHQTLIELLKNSEQDLEIAYVTHERFKKETSDCKAVVRTGEVTPFANLILISGVTF